MTHFCLTPDAESDLIEIRRFTIHQWSSAQSKKYLSKIRQTMRLLAETPTIGTSRPDVGKNVLSFPRVSHIIYYIVHDNELIVFGVLHKQMVPLNHLTGRDML